MSYDLDLYLAKPTKLDPPPTGDTALFNADPPARAENEDIPESYLPLIGKRRRWLIRLTIEGQPTPDEMATFEAWLRATITDMNACLIDEQAGTFQTTKKTGPLPDAAMNDDTIGGEMSLYLTDANWFHETGFALMLETIKRILPDALPQRYGQYEPMQGKVENGDTSAILADFKEDPDIFMRAKTPFSWIFMSVPCDAETAKWHENHFLRNNFLATRIEFQLRDKAFEKPGLNDLLVALSMELGVFYSEIRRGECPVKGWFWRGLPDGAPSAVCIGAPYLDHWPDARANGIALTEDLVFLAPTRLDPSLPRPPSDLVEPKDAGDLQSTARSKYAPVFPFAIPGA